MVKQILSVIWEGDIPMGCPLLMYEDTTPTIEAI